MENLNKYNEIFRNVFLIDESALNDDFNILNIDKWDSVAHMRLISEIEDTFGILFDTDDIINFSSYTVGKEILRKYNIQL